MPSIYQEQIIDHYKFPRNFKKIEDPTTEYGDKNPTCGDEIQIFIKFDDNDKVVDIGFQGKGCAISMASASLLTEMILEEGMTKDDLRELTNDDIKEMLSIPLTPVRLKCAILPLKVLEGALIKLEGGNVGSSIKK